MADNKEMKEIEITDLDAEVTDAKAARKAARAAKKADKAAKKALKPKKKHIGLIITGVVVVAFIIFCVNNVLKAKELMKEMTSTGKETASVEYRYLIDSIAATGKIVAADAQDVSANISGVEFESIEVEVGDYVEAGDLMATFDTSTIEANLKDAETQLAATESNSDISVGSAERALQEAEQLRNIDAERASQDCANAWNDYLRAITDIEQAEEKYHNAQKDTADALGELEAAKRTLNSAAPYAAADIGAIERMFENDKTALSTALQSGFDYCVGVESNICVSGATYIAGIISTATGDNPYRGYFTKDDGSEISSSDVISGITDALEVLYQDAILYSNTQINGDNENNYASAEAAVASWQAKYDAAKATEEQLKTAYESACTASTAKLQAYEKMVRAQEDYARNDASSIENKQDSVQTSYNNASTASLNTQQQIRNYEDQLENGAVVAPISGTVTAVKFDEGNAYASGSTIFTIEDESTYRVSAEIDEYDIPNIAVGQRVVIKTNGTGEDELEGVVSEIAPKATVSTSAANTTTTATNVTYNVMVDITTKDDRLRLDMTAKISIVVEEKESALSVPYDAVLQDVEGLDYVDVIIPSSKLVTDESNESGLFGKKSKGQDENVAPETKKVYITRGVESAYYIEVFGDIKEGDEVVFEQASGTSLEQLLMESGAMGGF